MAEDACPQAIDISYSDLFLNYTFRNRNSWLYLLQNNLE